MTALAASPVAFHISLNVSNIEQAVDFFSKVFGTPPSKHREDYAKFELTNPPLTLSLEPGDPTVQGALNHVGFKFQSSADLVEVQRRLESSGIHSQREEGVECCYALQTKFWLHDPDRTMWEMYVLDGDIAHRGAGQELQIINEIPCSSQQPSKPIRCVTLPVKERSSWSHRLGSPLTIPEDLGHESLDEVALQGTFNGLDSERHMDSFLARVAQALKPGGVLSLHCLTADRHLNEIPSLPGPASVVQAIPCLNRLIQALESAGFESIQLKKYGSSPCFTAGDAELRETKLEATNPAIPGTDHVTVVYRGPFAEIQLDTGERLRRGIRTEVIRSVFEQLKATSAGDSVVEILAATSAAACTG